MKKIGLFLCSFLVVALMGICAFADAPTPLAGLPVLNQVHDILAGIASSPLLVIGGPILFEFAAKLWPTVNPQGIFLIAGSVLGKAGAIISQLGDVVTSLDDVVAKAIPHNIVAADVAAAVAKVV